MPGRRCWGLWRRRGCIEGPRTMRWWYLCAVAPRISWSHSSSHSGGSTVPTWPEMPSRSVPFTLSISISATIFLPSPPFLLPSSSPGGKVGSHEADTSHARQDLVPLAGEQQRLVHLPPALVGSSDPRLLRDLHRPQLASRGRKKKSCFKFFDIIF